MTRRNEHFSVDPSLEINSKEESTGNPNQDDQNQQQQGGQQAQGGQQGGQNKPGQGGQQQGGQNKPGRQGGQERRSKSKARHVAGPLPCVGKLT